MRKLMRHGLVDEILSILFQQLTVKSDSILPVIGLTSSQPPLVIRNGWLNLYAVQCLRLYAQLGELFRYEAFSFAESKAHKRYEQKAALEANVSLPAGRLVLLVLLVRRLSLLG